MLLKMHLPVEQGNEAIRDGSLAETLEATMARLRPEAAYFTTLDGERTALVVFDLDDPSSIPVIAEPLFQALDASVEFVPVMNLDELQRGLGRLGGE